MLLLSLSALFPAGHIRIKQAIVFELLIRAVDADPHSTAARSGIDVRSGSA
jgi:hypothetical protein